MRRRRASARRVKIHHSYTVEEAAETTGVHRNTVPRWITTEVLPALTEKRPHLILGRDLHRFLSIPKTGTIRLKPGECYCVKCHLAKRPALRMADYVPLNHQSGNLRGLFPDCGILMYRRVSLPRLPVIAADLAIKILEAHPRLSERDGSSTNDDFGKV